MVAKSHDDSNYKLAKDNLLSKVRCWDLVIDNFWIEDSCGCLVFLNLQSIDFFFAPILACLRRKQMEDLESWCWYVDFILFDFFFQVNVFPRHICSINDTVSVEEAATEYEFAIRQMVRTRTVAASDNSDSPRFDLILLGMGPDGHVASLFPNHPALEVKDDWVTFLTDSPKPPPERITFTLPVINSAANVVVVATGESKANAMHLAIDDIPLPESSLSLPARLVHPSNGNLIWFMDKPAGSKLERFKIF